MARRRFAPAATLLGAAACAFVTGCLVPYAYPKLDYIPGGAPTNSAISGVTDVHAFRVDVTAHQTALSATSCI